MGNASPESPFTLYESYAITRLSLCFFNLFLDNDGYMSWGIIGLSWPLESQLDRRNNVLHCSSEFIDANLIFPTTQCNLVVCNYVGKQANGDPLLAYFANTLLNHTPKSLWSLPRLGCDPSLLFAVCFCCCCFIEFQTDDNRFTGSIKCSAPCNCYSFIGTQITSNPIQFGTAMRFNLCKLKCVKYGNKYLLQWEFHVFLISWIRKFMYSMTPFKGSVSYLES